MEGSSVWCNLGKSPRNILSIDDKLKLIYIDLVWWIFSSNYSNSNTVGLCLRKFGEVPSFQGEEIGTLIRISAFTGTALVVSSGELQTKIIRKPRVNTLSLTKSSTGWDPSEDGLMASWWLMHLQQLWFWCYLGHQLFGGSQKRWQLSVTKICRYYK